MTPKIGFFKSWPILCHPVCKMLRILPRSFLAWFWSLLFVDPFFMFSQFWVFFGPGYGLGRGLGLPWDSQGASWGFLEPQGARKGVLGSGGPGGPCPGSVPGLSRVGTLYYRNPLVGASGAGWRVSALYTCWIQGLPRS